MLKITPKKTTLQFRHVLRVIAPNQSAVKRATFQILAVAVVGVTKVLETSVELMKESVHKIYFACPMTHTLLTILGNATVREHCRLCIIL